jgi:hypothetical protein
MTWSVLGWCGFVCFLPSVAASLSGCSASSGGDGANGGAGTSTTGATSTAAAGGAPSGVGGGSVAVVGSGGGSGGLDECTDTGSEAKPVIQPADIIIAVDTSGSMNAESDEVQQNLNEFASIIAMNGVDVHVILIADSGVCIPAPLGSGQCDGSDENLPGYRHVLQEVLSNDSLELILETYPQWKDSLRPDASKTLAVVTDDDSDLSAADFTSQLLALDPPMFEGFKFDSIYAFDGPSICNPFNCPSNDCCAQDFFCTPYSDAKGTEYQALVAQTNGVGGNLCEQDFNPMFQDMATAVVTGAGISCDYPIPEPPRGETLDPDEVNVEYTEAGETRGQPIYFVPGGFADCSDSGGWYYDDNENPTTIIICPSTCASFQGKEGALKVLFGCTTEVVPA